MLQKGTDLLDTVPDVGLVHTEVWHREAVIVCFYFTQYTSGIAVFFATLRYIFHEVASAVICLVCVRRWRQMVVQGSWCYTRESWAASILSGEPAVPGKIPGGVSRDQIPGSSGSTQSGVPTVPGKIPGGIVSRPTPAGQQSGVVSSIFLSIPGQVVALFITGGESYLHQQPCGDERFDGR